MSPEMKCNMSLAVASLVMALTGIILGAGITWGSSLTRLSSAEKSIEAQQVQINQLLQMQLSVIRIEQAVTDIARRLDRVEK
jgi:hypothetical protein